MLNSHDRYPEKNKKSQKTYLISFSSHAAQQNDRVILLYLNIPCLVFKHFKIIFSDRGKDKVQLEQIYKVVSIIKASQFPYSF